MLEPKRDVAGAQGEVAGMRERILGCSRLGGLAGPSAAALLELGRVERFPRRQRVVQQGEPPRSVLVLGAGRIKLERVVQGRTFPVGHRGPGETVGETALAGAAAATENATVLDDAEALVFPLPGLRKLVAADPAVRGAVASALVHRQLDAEARLASLLLRGVEARLVEFLLASVARWGQPHPAGRIVSAPFTHADIALLIGSTRETVTLLLGRLKRAELIAFDRRRIVIRDADGLGRRGTAPEAPRAPGAPPGAG